MLFGIMLPWLSRQPQDVEHGETVDHINQAARVQHHVIALRCALSGHRFGNEEADLALPRNADVISGAPYTSFEYVADVKVAPDLLDVDRAACSIIFCDMTITVRQ
jgi:hypothetical protein